MTRFRVNLYADTIGGLGHRRERDGHNRRAIQCPRCKAERVFHVFVAPDPRGAGQRRAERDAQAWISCHPCVGAPSVVANAIATNTTGNIRRRRAAA